MADTATTGVAAAAQTNEPLIRVEGLRKSFGSLEVLKGIDLSMQIRPRWGAGPSSVTKLHRLDRQRMNPSA